MTRRLARAADGLTEVSARITEAGVDRAMRLYTRGVNPSGVLVWSPPQRPKRPWARIAVGIAITLIAVAALLLNFAFVDPGIYVSTRVLVLGFVAVIGLLPVALIPVRRRMRVGRIFQRDAFVTAQSFAPVDALPIAALLGSVADPGWSVFVAIAVASVARDSVLVVMGRGSRGQWLRIPILAATRLLLTACLFLLVTQLPLEKLDSWWLAVAIPVAMLLGYAWDLAAEGVLRRIQDRPGLRTSAWSTWRGWALNAVAGLLIACAWIWIASTNIYWAPSFFLIAWIATLLLLSWNQDRQVVSAMRFVSFAGEGLADAISAGHMRGSTARMAITAITARAVGLMSGADCVQAVLIVSHSTRADEIDGVRIDSVQSVRPRPRPVREVTPSAITIDLPDGTRFAITCWDRFGTPITLAKFAPALNDSLTRGMREIHRATERRRVETTAFRRFSNEHTAVVAADALREAFDVLQREDSETDGAGIVVIAARLTTASTIDSPPEAANEEAITQMTRSLIRRTISSQSESPWSVYAAVTRPGQIAALFGGFQNLDQSRHLVESIAREFNGSESVAMTLDGVATLTVVLGAAIQGVDAQVFADLLDIAQRRSLGGIALPHADPWLALTVALDADDPIVTIPGWMFTAFNNAYLQLSACLESDESAAAQTILVPTYEPDHVPPVMLEALRELGVRVGLPITQLSTHHPLWPQTEFIVVDEQQASSTVGFAALALASATGLSVVGLPADAHGNPLSHI